MQVFRPPASPWQPQPVRPATKTSALSIAAIVPPKWTRYCRCQRAPSRPVVQRFSHRRLTDLRIAVEIGDRARHTQRSMVRPRTHLEPL